MRIFINRIAEIIIKHLDGDLTEPEQAELNEWLERSEKEKQFFDKVTDKEYITAQLEQLYSYDKESGWKKLEEQYSFSESPAVKMNPSFNWKRLAVAASVLLVIGLGSYFLFFNKKQQQIEIVKEETKDVKAPDTNRATITLADGRMIYLDSAGNGTLATTGNGTVTKNERGEIVYNGSAKAVEYNTLFNPRGSKVQPLTLSDGTTLWLNAESSVTYPTAFVGDERKVTVTGEAYFEVAHNESKPFIVSKGDMSVQVLGTHFNVNAYDDETNIKVTLLEGSVKVNNKVVIKPGQQAVITKDVAVKNGVDLEEVMAWKNGKFQFVNSDLKSIMRQLMRWYDVEVVYEGKNPDRYFTADVSRDKNLSSILKILELNDVHFRLNGKKLIVLPD